MGHQDMKKLEDALRSLRNSDDPALRGSIRERFPANWDMEDVFQKSLKQAESPAPPSIRRRLYCFAGAAACLAVTLLLTQNVWSRKQPIETLPPSETVPVTTAETTQTTAQTTAQTSAQTTASTSVQTTVTQTTAISAETQTTAPETETEIPTEPAATAVIETPAPVIETPAPVIETPAPVIETPAPAIETAPIITETAPIPSETEPVTEPSSSETTAESAPAQYLEGYSIQTFGARAKVTYMGEIPAHEERTLHINGIYSLQSAEQDMTIVVFTPEDRFFCDLPADEGSFAFWCDADAELTASQVCGDPAVFAVTEEQSTLFWSDGKFTFWVVSDTKNQEEMLETASVFMQLYAY